MMRCPKCRAATRTRTSEELSPLTRRSYHQCQNMHCGHTFTTMTQYEKAINDTKPTFEINIPQAAFPRSHIGDGQLTLEM